MAGIKIKASKEAFERAGEDLGDFVVPSSGYYHLQLKECSFGYSKSKNGDGTEDKDRPRIQCIWSVVGVGREGAEVTENFGQVWDYVSFSEDAEWKRAEFLYALGLADGTESVTMTIDPEALGGETVLGRLKQVPNQAGDGKQAKVAKLLPLEDADAEGAFGGKKSKAEDPFGEAESEEDSDYVTEEELTAMDLKAVGEVAKEFDLDPKEYVVNFRGKFSSQRTQAKLIAAILEAQGAEPEGSDGEGENPF